MAVAWAGMGAVTYRLAAAPVRTSLILTARLDGVLAAEAKIDGTACFWVGTGTDRTACQYERRRNGRRGCNQYLAVPARPDSGAWGRLSTPDSNLPLC